MFACRQGPFLQLPFWNLHGRFSNREPRFLLCQAEGAVAWAAVVEYGFTGIRFGALRRGPVVLLPGVDPKRVVESLLSWARERSYTFLRFSSMDPALRSAVGSFSDVREEEPYPFQPEFQEELVLKLDPDPEVMLARFNKTCRKHLRYAVESGYRIVVSRDCEALRAAWPLYVEHSGRKGLRSAAAEQFRAIADARRQAGFGAAVRSVAR